jgi:5-formyltetrahydrofolate cyclo-ligase
VAFVRFVVSRFFSVFGNLWARQKICAGCENSQDSNMKRKEIIREKIWSRLEENRVARFPGTQGRIPNFIGAEACAKLLAGTFYWKKAKVLKVNPDSPQRAIRQRALTEGKTLYMAVPRLRSDKPFIELDPKRLKGSPYAASSIKGAARYGRAVGLDEVKKVDLIVCGSVAVNRKGARVGKGGGYSDLEFALLTEHKRISPRTPIVTSVHPLQIIEEDLPMTEHDIPLTAIVTPEETIEIKSHLKRPTGICWEILPSEKIDTIPVLKRRKRN